MKRRNRRVRNIIFIIILLIICINVKNNNSIKKENNTEEVIQVSDNLNKKQKQIKKNLEWNLILVNSENKIPEEYKMSLENIEGDKSFDSRAIQKLKDMMYDIKSNGITDIWIQSSYRSVERQKYLYNRKVQQYISQGENEEKAKELTERTINKPGHSEHNLGLAIDFNNVKYTFENTKAFQWLKENAQNYGFILRYAKEKEDITKVDYEPWHWRYVGEEHAKKMNELGLCLEEYIEYLNN